MALRFTQKEIELEISNILAHGDIDEIHRISRIGYSILSQQLNPNDERKSSLYLALEIICALDEHSPERGERVWQTLKKRRELSKPIKLIESSADTEAGKFAKESGEALSARLEGKSRYQQFAEAVEAEAQAKRYKDSLIAEINAENDSFDSNRNRLKVI